MKSILVVVSVVSHSFAQGVAPKTTPPSDSMVLVRGRTIQTGIDASEIPQFEKIFDIANAQLFQDEVPKHSVTVTDFHIDRHLVTNAQFKRFIDANTEWRPGRFPPALDNGNYPSYWTTSELTTRADHPVVSVDWYAAVAYCRWEGGACHRR